MKIQGKIDIRGCLKFIGFMAALTIYAQHHDYSEVETFITAMGLSIFVWL